MCNHTSQTEGVMSGFKFTFQEPEGVSNIEVWEQDGYFKCSFTQALNLAIPDTEPIDLTKKHYLLVATGAGMDM